jgi:Cdc6-like AAA superfamily ATPase
VGKKIGAGGKPQDYNPDGTGKTATAKKQTQKLKLQRQLKNI